MGANSTGVTNTIFYRPQTKFGALLYFHKRLSVILSTGGCLPLWYGGGGMSASGSRTYPLDIPPGHTPLLDTHPRHTPWTHTPPDRHTPFTPPLSTHTHPWSTSGQYTSYWNAFLFAIISRNPYLTEKKW